MGPVLRVEKVQVSPPRLWKYLLTAAVMLFFLIPAWLLLEAFILDTREVTDREFNLAIARSAVIPIVMVFVLLARRWCYAAHFANLARGELARQAELRLKQEQQVLDERTKREFCLEVLGLGVVYEHFTHSDLWDALQQGDAYTAIRDQDPKRYAWAGEAKLAASKQLASEVFGAAARGTPAFLIAPLLSAAPPGLHDPAGLPLALPEGMAWHMFVDGSRRFDGQPDSVVEQAFNLFDAHPDLPYLVLFADNSLARREQARAADTPPLVRDGYHVPAVPDAIVALVLARRDRVTPLRRHAWDDPKNDYARASFCSNHRACQSSGDTNPRGIPTAEAWLSAAAELGKNPMRHVVVPGSPFHMKAWDNDPPKTWKATPWLPVAWTREQLDCFDRLPTLGYLHRPVVVDFSDDQGSPITRNDRRLELLMAGWRQALDALPADARAAGPSRVIAATGNQERQLLALHGLLHQYAAQGGTEINTSDSAQFIDMDRRLGDTGPATPPLQAAIGLLGCRQAGGITAAINLCDANRASIVFIRPPSEEASCAK